jgi:hypothetical protein
LNNPQLGSFNASGSAGIIGRIYQGGTTNAESQAQVITLQSLHTWSSATNSSAELAAIGRGYYNGGSSPTYSCTAIRYFDTAFPGNYTTGNYTVPYANSSHVIAQNTANMIVSTNSGAPINFSTGNGVLARLESSGYFGIGTNSTGGGVKSKLHVVGASSFAGAPTNVTSKAATLLITDGTLLGGAGGTLELGSINDDGVHRGFCAIKGYLNNGGGFGTGTLRFFNRVATGTSEMAEVMMIDNAGNLGIGAAPSQKLTVQGNISLTGNIISPQVCKAWVNFNGTGTSIGGNPPIRSQFNVGSITDVAVGKYQLNFTTVLSNTNYAVFCGCAQGTTLYTGTEMEFAGITLVDRQLGGLTICSNDDSQANRDAFDISVMVMGT